MECSQTWTSKLRNCQSTLTREILFWFFLLLFDFINKCRLFLQEASLLIDNSHFFIFVILNIIVAQNTLKLFSNSELLLFQLGRKSRFPPKKSFITQTPKHGYYFGYIILSQRLPMISIFYTNHINFDRSCHVWDETCRIILLKIIDIILKTSSRYLNPGIARKFTDLFIPIFGNLP